MKQAIVRIEYDESLLEDEDWDLEEEFGWLEESGITVISVEELN